MRFLDKTLLVCPTYNPGEQFLDWLAAFASQSMKPSRSVIVDSSSFDTFPEKAREYGFEISVIPKESFDHGATRQLIVDNYDDFEYVIFLTQDAILADDKSLSLILEPFEDSKVAAVCGRQLPRKQSAPIERHARIYNYPSKSFVRSIADKKMHGLKTAFLSNSFAAYRVSALREVGGFPKNTIFGEDFYVAAKLLASGYKTAYSAGACVYHSHNYSLFQEFSRYFDMGVFHAKESWIMQEFGKAESEGQKFVISEIKYLLRHAFWRIPEAVLRTLFRYTGFRLGLMEKGLPLRIKRVFAMNRSYFK